METIPINEALYKCDDCKKEKPLSEIEILRPKPPDTLNQCHPFMEMECICEGCVVKMIVATKQLFED